MRLVIIAAATSRPRSVRHRHNRLKSAPVLRVQSPAKPSAVPPSREPAHTLQAKVGLRARLERYSIRHNRS